MDNCKRSYACLATLIIAIVIFVQTNVLTIMIFQLNTNTKQAEQIIKKDVVSENEWKLKIPKINLSSCIEEGTSQEVINNSIGHFTNTSYLDGNIGLVAGCYGYQKNIFENLEKLQQGDIILYEYDGKQKEYKVSKNIIIDEKDWSHLDTTKENKLTLITGVINEPEKRRCVQAEETN